MRGASTYDIMKSYLTRVRDKEIRNGSTTLKQALLCDKIRSCMEAVYENFIVRKEQMCILNTSKPAEIGSKYVKFI